MRGRLRAVAALGCAAALLTGCSLSASWEEGINGQEQDSEHTDYGQGPYVREGLFGGHAFPARVSVQHVERWPDRSVLRFTMNTLKETDKSYIFQMNAFSGGLTGRNWAFSLVDPVNQVHYAPLLNAEEESIGSPMPNAWVPGADYEIEVHFPPIPEGVERLSVHAVGTNGDFTGIPVIDGEPPENPPSDSSSHGDIEPGDNVRMKLRDTEIAGDPQERVSDLYSITDRPDMTQADSPEETTVALHSDVLFELDKAELTDKARTVLEDVAEETRSEADPSQPPITIVGHTDGQGSDEYNQDLSERRAEAVHKALAEELGSDYIYKTEGRGATEPVAEETGEDIEEARAANRRVEISYRIRPEAEQGSASDGDGAKDGGGDRSKDSETTDGHAAPPAPFRDDDGEIQATGSAELLNGDAGYELNVYPMYRDGAYLVGVYELVHDGGEGSVPHVIDPLADDRHRGSDFTVMSVSLPGDDKNLRGVRIGPAPKDEIDDAAYISSRGYPFPSDGESRRVFAYFPAPAEDVTEVDLDAGPFGEFPGIPVA
ncbi:hypothetical protein GCM10009799_31220 [Nocardiopsis rhodophaea]|uniref:OmpA-like domain-containing protein n=1 Tax=Nocardiopsis rhodophaea TaxID=280238 RepID=A0ABN2T8V6_9ACTN